MKCSSKHLSILLFLFLSWTKSLSSASKEVSSVIHPSAPFVRVLDEQKCFITTVASTNTNGVSYTSLQLNTSGNAVISYYDSTNKNLMLAVCIDAVCSSPTITTVDGATTNVDAYTSLQLSTSGNAVISYRGRDNLNLMLAVCNDPACSSPTITKVDGIIGKYTSLQLNTNGNAVISYYDFTSVNLKLAVCNDAACSSPTITTIDSTNTNIGDYTSLQLNTSGNAVISYYDSTSKNLMLAVCNDAVCSSPTITTLDSTNTDVGSFTSLQLNTSGNAVISYYDSTNKNLMLAVCNDAVCSSPTIKTVDSINTDVGSFMSLQLNTSGNAVISYYDSTNKNLMLAVCNDAVCSSPTITTVESANTYYTSLQLNTSGNAVISYQDIIYGTLMLASCTIATISAPSGMPSLQPTLYPSAIPWLKPKSHPSHQPSTSPSSMLSLQPSHQPTLHPSAIPSLQPSHQPSISPSGMPSLRPSHQPNLHPSHQPSKSKDKRKKTKAKKKKTKKTTTPKVGKKVKKRRKKANK